MKLLFFCLEHRNIVNEHVQKQHLFIEKSPLQTVSESPGSSLFGAVGDCTASVKNLHRQVKFHIGGPKFRNPKNKKSVRKAKKKEKIILKKKK